MSLTFASAPRISLRQWTDVLTRFNSPVAPVAAECYGICVSAGIDPCVALAFFGKESTFGTRGRSVQWRSWGNMRAAEDTSLANPPVPGLDFATYPTWKNSLKDWCAHINRRYLARGLNTIRSAVPVYAPSSDGNDVQAYIDFIEQHALQWQTEDHPTMQTTGYADRDDLLPESTKEHPDGRTGEKLSSFESATIHETANENPGATAKMHHDYWMPGGSGALISSVQFVADSTESIQLIPIDERAEHAGDTTGNATSVGWEICVNSKDDFPAACRKTAVSVARVLHAEGKAPIDGVTVRKHGSWPGTTHKHCPAHLNAGDWGIDWPQFVAMVQQEYRNLDGSPPPMRFLTATLPANIRQAPTTTAPIAGQMKAGESAGFDSDKEGESIQGNSRWCHLATGLGFVWSGLLQEGT